MWRGALLRLAFDSCCVFGEQFKCLREPSGPTVRVCHATAYVSMERLSPRRPGAMVSVSE
jgi:hypothetical protein